LAGVSCREIGDGGEAEIEFLLVLVTLLALIFGAVQIGLLFYARSIVVAAANRGAQAASASSGTLATGQQAAERALSSLGPLDTSPSVEVVDRGGDVAVRASASVASIVPFRGAVPVRAVVVMHREGG
jgi:Flp pilus assembly protein TadG